MSRIRRILLLLLVLPLLAGCRQDHHGPRSTDIPLYSGPVKTDDPLPQTLRLFFWTGGDGTAAEVPVGETLGCFLSSENRLSDGAGPERLLRFSIVCDTEEWQSPVVSSEITASFSFDYDDIFLSSVPNDMPAENWDRISKNRIASDGEAIRCEPDFTRAFEIATREVTEAGKTEQEYKEEMFTVTSYQWGFRYRTAEIWSVFPDGSYPSAYSAAVCRELSLTMYLTFSVRFEDGTALNGTGEAELLWRSPFTMPGADVLSWEGVEPCPYVSLTFTSLSAALS